MALFARAAPGREGASGSARTPLALALLLVPAAALAFAFFGRPTRSGPPRSARSPAGETETPATREGRADPARRALAPESLGAVPPAPGAPPAMGTVRGRVLFEDGPATQVSSTVRLLLADPAAGAPGSVVFERRLASGESSFRFENVPFSAWRVRAEAEGWNPAEVVLLLTPETSDALVHLALRPGGLLDGVVADEEGTPLEGIELRLEPLDPTGGPGRSATTDPAGRFRFDGVVEGRHRLTVGPRASPYLEPLLLDFRGRSHREDLRLPVPGAIEVSVADSSGGPLPEATVEGYGPPGGTFRLRADLLGRATARNLPPGDYRILARDEGSKTALREAKVEARATTRVAIALEP